MRRSRRHSLVLALVLGAATAACSSSPGAPSGDDDPNPPEPQVFVAGETYFGENQYVEYQAGNLPVVLSAPHGGTLTPDAIPDRTFGVTVRDTNTEEVIREVARVIRERTGAFPHIVISRLRRTKLDPNREVVEAAQGNAIAIRAWTEYHGFIDSAKAEIESSFDDGLYLDLHGHGHQIQRLELGYLLGSSELALPDEELNVESRVRRASVRRLSESRGHTLSDLLRGPSSFGTLIEEGGYPAVPSRDDPAPGDAPYFNGGYSTVRHGSREGGEISGIQIEMNFTGVRDTAESRRAFAEVLVDVIEAYFVEIYGRPLGTP